MLAVNVHLKPSFSLGLIVFISDLSPSEAASPLPEAGPASGGAAGAFPAAAERGAGVHRHHRLGGGRQARHGQDEENGKGDKGSQVWSSAGAAAVAVCVKVRCSPSGSSVDSVTSVCFRGSCWQSSERSGGSSSSRR